MKYLLKVAKFTLSELAIVGFFLIFASFFIACIWVICHFVIKFW